jgi:uncharacterized membrane protein
MFIITQFSYSLIYGLSIVLVIQTLFHCIVYVISIIFHFTFIFYKQEYINNANKHTKLCTCTHAHTCTHERMHARSCIHTYIHTCSVHTYTHTRMHIQMYKSTYIHTFMIKALTYSWISFISISNGLLIAHLLKKDMF